MTSHPQLSPGGRWRGALTSRPLPEHDPSLEALCDEDRRDLVAVWIGRAASEQRVSTSFQIMRDSLTALAAPEDLRALAARGIDDELRHAEICRTVASRIAGTEVAQPPPLAFALPQIDAPEETRHALYVLGHCALNETTASAFLEATLTKTRGALARAALRELLADEMDHGRIGWSHLATLAPAARRRLVPWLAPLVAANLRSWRATPRLSQARPALVAHGAPDPDTVEHALLTATRELIVPGLAHLGLPTDAITVG
jgi:hypothetical protein